MILRDVAAPGDAGGAPATRSGAVVAPSGFLPEAAPVSSNSMAVPRAIG